MAYRGMFDFLIDWCSVREALPAFDSISRNRLGNQKPRVQKRQTNRGMRLALYTRWMGSSSLEHVWYHEATNGNHLIALEQAEDFFWLGALVQ